MDFEQPPDKPIEFESHSVWDFSDPEQSARADPSARLAVEVLQLMLKEAGPLRPGQLREVESTGTIVLNGIKYVTRLVFQVSLPLEQPPTPIIPPDDLDVYRRS